MSSKILFLLFATALTLSSVKATGDIIAHEQKPSPDAVGPNTVNHHQKGLTKDQPTANGNPLKPSVDAIETDQEKPNSPLQRKADAPNMEDKNVHGKKQSEIEKEEMKEEIPYAGTKFTVHVVTADPWHTDGMEIAESKNEQCSVSKSTNYDIENYKSVNLGNGRRAFVMAYEVNAAHPEKNAVCDLRFTLRGYPGPKEGEVANVKINISELIQKQTKAVVVLGEKDGKAVVHYGIRDVMNFGAGQLEKLLKGVHNEVYDAKHVENENTLNGHISN